MLGDAAHHVARVLRARPGQLYELSDGKSAWLGRIVGVQDGRVDFALVEKLPAVAPRIESILLLAVVKLDSFEWAIEKATELGASRIVPLAAARTDRALLAAAPKRAERWKRIIAGAAQQSRRVQVPELQPLEKPAPAFASAQADWKLLFSERADAPPLALPSGGPRRSVCAAIGPEGGWTDEEIGFARHAGFADAALGKLILRTETAAIAALAVLNYLLGADAGVD